MKMKILNMMNIGHGSDTAYVNAVGGGVLRNKDAISDKLMASGVLPALASK